MVSYVLKWLGYQKLIMGKTEVNKKYSKIINEKIILETTKWRKQFSIKW